MSFQNALSWTWCNRYCHIGTAFYKHVWFLLLEPGQIWTTVHMKGSAADSENVNFQFIVFSWHHAFPASMLGTDIPKHLWLTSVCLKPSCSLYITVLLSIFCFVQYVTDVRMVQKRLQDAEEAIVFINKEEALYKWDQTCYPQVEVINDSIEPYQRLFGLVLKWQRTEKRSDFIFINCMHCMYYGICDFVIRDLKSCSGPLYSSLCPGGWMVPSWT